MHGLAGLMLADLGAEVIRIDPPGGPVFRDPATDMLSRGKSSLVLDLKTDAGRETALALAASISRCRGPRRRSRGCPP